MEHKVDEMCAEFKTAASNIAELLAFVKRDATVFCDYPGADGIEHDTPGKLPGILGSSDPGKVTPR